jgi:hypothetical protein
MRIGRLRGKYRGGAAPLREPPDIPAAQHRRGLKLPASREVLDVTKVLERAVFTDVTVATANKARK